MNWIYPLALNLHNLNRWFILVVLFWTLFRVGTGWKKQQSWGKTERVSLALFSALFGFQFLLGLTLYVMPGTLVNATLGGLSFIEIVKIPVLRFFTIEHPLPMIIAFGLSERCGGHMKKIEDDAKKFKYATIYFAIIATLITISIPWPMFDYHRPLVPFGF